MACSEGVNERVREGFNERVWRVRKGLMRGFNERVWHVLSVQHLPGQNFILSKQKMPVHNKQKEGEQTGRQAKRESVWVKGRHHLFPMQAQMVATCSSTTCPMTSPTRTWCRCSRHSVPSSAPKCSSTKPPASASALVSSPSTTQSRRRVPSRP